MAMGKEAFWKRGKPLRRKCNPYVKQGMVTCLIWSLTLYGTRTIGEIEMEKIKAFEKRRRRLAKMSWRDYTRCCHWCKRLMINTLQRQKSTDCMGNCSSGRNNRREEATRKTKK